MYTPPDRDKIRRRVHQRIRQTVRGTSDRPRLAVFRSSKHIYAQVIDDSAGRTVAAASTMDKGLGLSYGGNVEAARAVGKALGERARQAEISRVVFDRGGHKYHGRVRALADAAREAGLEF